MITQADLTQFTGTEQWYRHSLMRNVLYTDGVKYLAEKAQAYWLIDKIAALQLDPKIKAQDFQVWRLKVWRRSEVKDHAATLTCDDGGKPENDGDHHVIYREQIDYTDFPLDQIELWVEGGVILLPSEH